MYIYIVNIQDYINKIKRHNTLMVNSYLSILRHDFLRINIILLAKKVNLELFKKI